MTLLDWIILAVYLAFIVGMSAWIGQRQRSQEDYYLGGRSMPAWQIALSIMATQVSAISLIGAPAFIALKSNGGLVWLQYEFAIPLAMMLIMLVLVPVYHAVRAVTIYEYLERRFGTATRTTLSVVFLVSRGLGSGVALLATGIVTAVCLNWPLPETILLIGAVSVLYTTFGGIVADIYSDILQLFILWTGAIVASAVLFIELNQLAPDGSWLSFLLEDQKRLQVFDFSSSGIGDGQTFSFWPMLFGGLFLYLSYYGCDQSQAQRLLTTETSREAQQALFINGLLRFPLVLTYCTVGVLLLAFLHFHPDFAARLQNQPPDFLVPFFLIQYMPKGLLGLLIAGIFAASMSSLDSAMNSLSAATYRDLLIKIWPSLEHLTDRQKVRLSRWLTIFWGVVATGFALQMVGGSETVLELVNKIGSAFYGPILAIFWLGILTRSANQKGAIIGLAAGVGVNLFLWQAYGQSVSWMWWNLTGFAASIAAGTVASRLTGGAIPQEGTVLSWKDLSRTASEKKYLLGLTAAFAGILFVSALIEATF